jgi:hypothetical protein
MPTTWTIAIDWDRNGDYSDIYDDVTSRVIEAQWFLGQKKPYEHMADNSWLTLVLDNSDKRYSPENTSGPLWDSGIGRTKVQPFRTVKLTSNDGTARTHWVGWIESIQPLPGRYGKRFVTIIANGPMQFYMAAETKIALQENKHTDEILNVLLQEVVVPPALTGAWIVGRINFSELGETDLAGNPIAGTTWVADVSAYSNLYDPIQNPTGEPGIKTLDLAADNWVLNVVSPDAKKNTFDVYRALNDVVMAEHGKFLFDRTGKAMFWNRHKTLLNSDVTPVVSLNDTMQDLEYNYAGLDDLKNEVIVTCHPRTISPNTNDVLWQLASGQKIQIAPSSTKEMFVKYEDSSKNRVGGRNVTIQTVEYEKGTATIVVEDKANGANLKITNGSATSAVINKLILQGQKISDEGEIEVTAKDNDSIIDFGRRTLKLNLPSVGKEEEGQYIADFELLRRKEPRGYVASVKFLSHCKLGGSQHVQQLARSLGDMVELQETQTGHKRKYYIIGEFHKLFNAAKVWETTWYLEPVHTFSAPKVSEIQPADLLAYWKLADASGTTMFDSSGQARHGTASGVTWGQPGIGDGFKAAGFDGVNDYGNPYSSAFNSVWNGQEFTISGWFKVSGAGVWTDGQTRTLFSFRNGDTPVDSIVLRKDSVNNQLTCEYSANGTIKSVTVSSYSPTGWVHFAVTVSYGVGTGEMKFYLDGVQQGTTQTELGQWNNAQGLQTDICIGAATPSTNFWSGDLAHCRLGQGAPDQRGHNL